jgi:hypothetical protein
MIHALVGAAKNTKKCCYGKNTATEAHKHHLLPPYDDIHHDHPILDENFFKSNAVHEISGDVPRAGYAQGC